MPVMVSELALELMPVSQLLWQDRGWREKLSETHRQLT